jgi:hypothetical protein
MVVYPRKQLVARVERKEQKKGKNCEIARRPSLLLSEDKIRVDLYRSLPSKFQRLTIAATVPLEHDTYLTFSSLQSTNYPEECDPKTDHCYVPLVQECRVRSVGSQILVWFARHCSAVRGLVTASRRGK